MIDDPTITFVCDICGREVTTHETGREIINCPCGSTARWRAVIHVLSDALFGEAMPLPDLPTLPLKGIGLSDWGGYARGLAEKFDYENTFLEREPHLDITDPPQDRWGTADFLISSDVFEHVPPPVQRAFDGAFRLLKPGGIMVLTVPYMEDGETHEWFPSLHDYEIRHVDGEPILYNTTVDGKSEIFGNLQFHGGITDSLAMRLFSYPSLLKHLGQAGFELVKDWKGCFEFADSFPLLARRPN